MRRCYPILLAAVALAGCGEGGGAEGPPPAQRVAEDVLRGHAGAVVALDARSGDVLVSLGAFDTPVRPGSTLKALFAGLALDQGLIDAGTRLDGNGTIVAGQRNAGGERFGPITVAEALVRSSNTAFVDLTLRLGPRRIERALRALHWDRPKVPFVRAPRGGYRDPDLHQRASTARLADLAREIAAPSGRLWSPGVGTQLRRALREAVLRGTGQSMRDPDVPIAAKTGTMPRADGRNQASVIAMTPVDDPRYVVAVSVAAPPRATGGEVAGPIALEVLRALAGER